MVKARKPLSKKKRTKIVFPAETKREWAALMKSDPKKVKFVRSMEDWQRVLKNADLSAEGHPLYGCTLDQVEEFTKNLVFNKGGLAGMKYGMIMNGMTFRRLDLLGKLFGLGWELMKDYDNKYCAQRATCRTEMAAVCTSNC